jgi:WD40 repeat protein
LTKKPPPLAVELHFGDTSRQPYGIDWSRDGQYLVSGGRDGTIRLWDMTTFTPIGILTQPDIIVDDVAFSPDGSQVAAALDDGTARVWDVASGEQLSIFQQNGEMRSVAWSPDGAILAYGGLASDEAYILQLPLANAGPDQTLPDADASGTELATQDGSDSTDPDGTIVAYSWTDQIGTEIATGSTPTVDLPVGNHTFTLTVTDDDGLTASDTVVITVTSATGCVPPDPPLVGDYTVAMGDIAGHCRYQRSPPILIPNLLH